jgi:serine/tyrosine/threonine adenylyltransferase
MNIPASTALDNLRFDNVSLRDLPIDPERENRRRQIKDAINCHVQPTPVPAPQLIAWSREVAEQIGLDAAACTSPRFARVFAGNELLSGMAPHATCYGGHQFGSWAGQLGDGRAINLGEAITTSGSRLMLQLKGAGETPFSRTADGLAVLRSSVREFLCGEAMHHLGIPTTRALSLCATGRGVWRDMFYDGNPGEEPGAVVCRTAPSFLRFGHFELLAAREEIDLLKQLADFTIEQYFPEIAARAEGKDKYLLWFEEVCSRTATLIVDWMRVGFVHGVMNTDNMSILGLTIDYGPYGWLDGFDPNWTPNTSDSGGRYAYRNQPPIAQWNLLRLANAIYPLIGEAPPLETCLHEFVNQYSQRAELMMSNKLGLRRYDAELIDTLQALFGDVEVDMTLFYRTLGQLTPDNLSADDLEDTFYQWDADTKRRLQTWLDQYQATLTQQVVDAEARRLVMQQTNPAFILRNFLSQQAIDKAETGDFAEIHRLLEAARRPYEDLPEFADYRVKRPEWARRKAGCSQLSCSS